MPPFYQLKTQLSGELHTDIATRALYATDASAYREIPLAVVIPEDKKDIKKLIAFARQHKTSLIPRTAGTSLAGQVVGKGIIVDVSRTKNFTQILEVNTQEKWVRVQPGVVRDELNMYLKTHGLFFGPETSTANRAMIGGMVGNNSCGSNSVVYGSTRDQLLEAEVILSDGTEVTLRALSKTEFMEKVQSQSNDLESQLYRRIYEMLKEPERQDEIRKEFPKASIPRRNTGYAIDLLLETNPFTATAEDFNFCKLLAGSEGTLAFTYSVKLRCHPLPPRHKTLVCAHFDTVGESLQANLIALEYQPTACELMDHYILECTKSNIEQNKNRFFVKGNPAAILIIELSGEKQEEVEEHAKKLIDAMQAAGLGNHYPLVRGENIKKVWNLRKAGLGLLSNLPGDAKPVPVIEDTAVDVKNLPAYIKEFNQILKKYGLYSVHYAHASSGELHLRPILNLKTHQGNQMFRTIAEEIALLVKKYKGSLSGEHGDGRLRGEFIKQMIGEKNYTLIKAIKKTWDADNIFNPNKIVDTPPMNQYLRYTAGQSTPKIKTTYNFEASQGIIRAAELCNGSGDCRKSHLSGGTMCPSYMATRNEKDTTRARANILREFLTHSDKKNRFDHKEIYEVMDLCLSCKACKSECPSNVDIAKLKGEFLQNYQDANGVSLRNRLITAFNFLNTLASLAPGLYNLLLRNRLTGRLFKQAMGIAEERSMPALHTNTFYKWYSKHKSKRQTKSFPQGKVYLFCDEFTNFNDVPIGIAAVQLLENLGYEVIIPKHIESGRIYLSKGFIKKAKNIAVRNIDLLSKIVTAETPLIGIEPSAILSLRDEYLGLAYKHQRESAKSIAQNTFLIEEFISREIDKGNISKVQFTPSKKKVQIHGHCHQKTLSSLGHTQKALALAYDEVSIIPSGCCGMAGSFGYEKEHYQLSMDIGELVLFPAVRKANKQTILVASGTSCRHQIADGTRKKALHIAEVLSGDVKSIVD